MFVNILFVALKSPWWRWRTSPQDGFRRVLPRTMTTGCVIHPRVGFTFAAYTPRSVWSQVYGSDWTRTKTRWPAYNYTRRTLSRLYYYIIKLNRCSIAGADMAFWSRGRVSVTTRPSPLTHLANGPCPVSIAGGWHNIRRIQSSNLRCRGTAKKTLCGGVHRLLYNRRRWPLSITSNSTLEFIRSFPKTNTHSLVTVAVTKQ